VVSSGASPGISRAAHVSGVTGEPERLLYLAASGARLQRLAGIVALRRRRYVRTVRVRQHETPTIPNRLLQQFAVSAMNRVWAGDPTFVPTRTG